jgi:hypothetical protein
MNNPSWSTFQQILPLVIPVIIIQIILLVTGLLDLIKQPATRGPKWMWALIIPFVQIIGPILYFTLGRKEE